MSRCKDSPLHLLVAEAGGGGGLRAGGFRVGGFFALVLFALQLSEILLF